MNLRMGEKNMGGVEGGRGRGESNTNTVLIVKIL